MKTLDFLNSASLLPSNFHYLSLTQHNMIPVLSMKCSLLNLLNNCSLYFLVNRCFKAMPLCFQSVGMIELNVSTSFEDFLMISQIMFQQVNNQMLFLALFSVWERHLFFIHKQVTYLASHFESESNSKFGFQIKHLLLSLASLLIARESFCNYILDPHWIFNDYVLFLLN